MSQSAIDIETVMDEFEQSFLSTEISPTKDLPDPAFNSGWGCNTWSCNCSYSPSPCGNTYLNMAMCVPCT